jgi:hypothetical protein
VKERKRQGSAYSDEGDKEAILCQGDHQQNIDHPLVAKVFVRKIRPHIMLKTTEFILHPKNGVLFLSPAA